MEIESIGVLPEKVNLVVSKAPILSPIFEEKESGQTLRDIFDEQTQLSEQHTKIFINGEEQEDWSVQTKDGDVVSVCQVPSGTEIGAYLIYAAITFAVGAIIGYIVYKSIDQPALGDGGQGQRLKKITGARNQATPYEPIPFILGRQRVVPNYAAQPYTYWDGDEQYLKMLLCVGYGPLNVSDIKIGDAFIGAYSDIRYEVLDWHNKKSISSIRKIWNTDVQQEEINQELDITNALNRSTPANTNKMILDYTFPAGLWRGDDPDSTRQGIQFRFKLDGYRDYAIAKVRNTTELGNSGVFPTLGAYRDLFKIRERYYVAQNSDGAGTAYASGSRTEVTDQVVLEKDGFAYIREYENGTLPYVNTLSYLEATRGELKKSFTWEPIDPETGERYEGEFSWRINKLQLTFGDNDNAANRIDLLSARYELDTKVDESYFGVDEQKKQYPVLIALDIRASNQLSGVIDNLSCRAQSLVPVSWLTSDYKNFDINSNWYTTKNPADLYKWVLQGPFNGAAVDNNKIDTQALSSWWIECQNKGWECNEIISEPTNLKDLLNNIAFTGRAFFSMKEGKFSVIENKAKDNPVQIFTTKNSSGLQSKREFKLETDGIKYKFANADYAEQEDEGIYGDPAKFTNSNIKKAKEGVKETGRYEEFEVWGTTDPKLARKHARFAWFEDKLRREVYTLETDIEALVASRGDKVLVANDIIGVGLGQGFVKDIDGNGFRIDETIGLTTGNIYSVIVRSIDFGTTFSTITATYNGDGWWTAGILPTNMVVGDLASYGEPDVETLECLVQEITYSDDYKATLTLVNYAPDLYDLDSTYLPDYQSGLTPERPRDKTPKAPNIAVNNGSFTYESNAIEINVTQKPEDRTQISSFSAQYRYAAVGVEEETGEEFVGGSWKDLGVSPADSGMYNVPVSNNQGSRIQVRAKAVNESGVHSPWSDIKEIELQSDPAPDVESFTVTETVDEPKTPDARWSTMTVEIEPPAVASTYLYAIAEYRQPEQDEWFTISKLGWRDPNSAQVQVYADGRQYEFRVRSVSVYGVTNQNGLSKIITTTNTSDPEYTEDNPFEELPAPNVRGLELFDQANDTEFTGKDAKFTWRKSTLNDWVEIGFEGLKGASASTMDQYFRDYEVRILADNRVARVENVVDNIYTYTFEKNAEDYKRRYGVAGAYREFSIEVVMRTRQNQMSEKPAILDVENPAPLPLTGINLIPGFRTITVGYNRPEDLDYSGVEVWVGTTSGFSVDDDTLVYDGPDTEVVISGLEPGTEYFVILRPYDSFGKVDVFSTEVSATTLVINTNDLDETQPDVVTGVAASTGVYDGRLQSTSYIDVSWDEVTNTRIANYTLDINNGESEYTVAGTSFRFTDAIPGESYTFKVRANSFTSIEGPYSDPTTIQAEVSDVQPATISGASVKAGLEKVVVEWTNPDSENFYSVNIHRSTSSTFTPSASNKIASVTGAIGSSQKSVDADVTNGTTYYYKLVPETLAGVQGGIVDAGSAVPFKIDSVNIDSYLEDAALVTRKIADNAIDLSGNKITGQLQNINLADAAVDSDKLADLSVDAAKLANGSIDLSGNKITGQLQGINLADAAVDSDKLANLSVDAAKLANGSVDLSSNKITGQLQGVNLADAAVDSDKLADLSVDASKIVDGSIIDSKVDVWLSGKSGTSFPTSPVDGQFFRRTDLDVTYRYNVATNEWYAVDFLEAETRVGSAVIGSAAIIDAAISSAKIEDAAITSAKIEDLAVGTAAIANAAITNAKIKNLAVDTAKIQDAAIESAKIADLAVGTAAIANAAITNAKIENLAVDTAKIQDAAITSAKIEDLAVGSAAIANAAITNAKIDNLAVDTAKISDVAITNAKIGNAAVDTAQINDAAIVTAKIADATIISAKIGDAEIKTANIDNLAVTDAKIAALDAQKITTGTLDADRIGADTITSDKINVTSLDAVSANMGTLTAGKISIGDTTTGLELDTLNGIRAFNSGTQTLHFKPDGTGYIGASQDISWDGNGNVDISGTLGAGSIFTNGQIVSANSGVEVVVGPKDFGAEGVYLLSGTDSVGNLVFGVDELGNATFDGAVTITGGTGISNLSDAGTLAGKDQADSGDVSFNYAGSSVKGGNANDTNNVAGESATTVKSNASAGATFTSTNAGGLAYKTNADWSTDITGSGKPADNADVTSQNAAKATVVPDTRDDNEDPSWYLTNYPQQVVSEFKSSSTVGVAAGETYVAMTTTVPWYNSSGGKIKQRVESDAGIFTRTSSSDTTWSAWEKVERDATKGADWNSTLSNIPDRVKDDATLGLNLTSTYMGYYDGTDFQSYIASDGSFHFGGVGDNFIDWNGSKLAINTDNLVIDPAGNATFSGDITGSEITGGKFQTSPTGKRVVLDGTDNSLVFYGPSNEVLASTNAQTVVNGTPYTPTYYLKSEGSGKVSLLVESTNFAHGVVVNTEDAQGVRVFSGGAATAVVASGGSGGGIFGDSVDGRGVEGNSTTNTGAAGNSTSSYGVVGSSAGFHGVGGNSDSMSHYDFYAIGVGANYGPFTGAHDGLILKGDRVGAGDILTSKGVFEKGSLSNTIPYVDVSGVSLSKQAYGVYVGRGEVDLTNPPAALRHLIPSNKLACISKTYDRVIGNALGEGQINVCSENGNFEAGDFICTSNIPGKGMRYDGHDMRYVVAKCMEPVNWEEEGSDVKMVACIYMCG